MNTVAWLVPLFVALSIGSPPPSHSRPVRVQPILDAWDGTTRTVHEWGTFTSVQGSDGVVLDGLRHNDRDLPKFVYELGGKNAFTGMSPKMETPVIYFYSPVKWKTDVRVEFPHGLLTQWYPAVTGANLADLRDPGNNWTPEWNAELLSSRKLEHGFLEWGTSNELTILPRGTQPDLPAVAEDDPWRFSRAVDSNALDVCNRDLAERDHKSGVVHEHERFLFYRGLGDFKLPLTAFVAHERVDGDRARFSLRFENANPKEPLTHLFLVYVDGDRAGFRELPDLVDALDFSPIDIGLFPIEDSTRALTERVAARLAETPLFQDEALAMSRTWAHAWFRDQGLRVLCVLPRELVDRELPLTIDKGWLYGSERGQVQAAQELPVIERVFVGRTEILTPSRERELVTAVEACTAGDSAGRERGRTELARYGRFALPYLARVKQLTRDPEVLAEVDRECERLRHAP